MTKIIHLKHSLININIYIFCYTGGKGTNWEGGLRVPAIASWPGIIAPGKIIGDTISSMDIFATAIDLAGGALPSDRIVDGRSFKSLLIQGDEALPQRTLFHYCADRLMAVTYGSYRVHLHTQYQLPPETYSRVCAKDGTPKFQFYHCGSCTGDCVTSHNPPLVYDLDRDPGELYSLDVKHLGWLLGNVKRIISVHQSRLKKGEPLLHTWNVQSLQPCCNPPYCMCNYFKNQWWFILA